MLFGEERSPESFRAGRAPLCRYAAALPGQRCGALASTPFGVTKRRAVRRFRARRPLLLVSSGGHVPDDSANLPDPDVIAAEIVEHLRAALEEFEQIAAELEPPERTEFRPENSGSNRTCVG